MPVSTPWIFLSYRRADSGGYAGRLADSLERHFGAGVVFHDVETIVPGADFAQAIDHAIGSAEAVLVLIGDNWLELRDAEGTRLIDRENDFVRIEAATALARDIPVLPLLVEGAKMPSAAVLPADIAMLARQHALELSDSRWDHDFQRLVDALYRHTGRRQPSSRRRRQLALVLAAGAAIALGALALQSRRQRLPDLTGRWDLPTGSFWLIVHDGDRFTIEETHYESKQVWKRGVGTIEDGTIRYTLDLVFDRRLPEEGTLRLSGDARTLSGDIGRGESAPATPIILTRQ